MLPLLLLPLLAGCLGHDAPDTTSAATAFEGSDAAARERFSYTLFLGITGTEGPLDWARYEAALASTGGPGSKLAEGFDQDVPNGALGDGKLGSWLTTHFAYDEENRLIGGYYTQTLADGTRHHVFAPFTGPYAGTTDLPDMIHGRQTPTGTALMAQLAPILPTLAAVADTVHTNGRTAANEPESDTDSDPVLCALRTHTDQWNISSEDAAAIAMADPEFQQHQSNLPGGELSYYYFPSLAVEEGCPVELDVPDNFWAISYTDLDTFLDPEVASPPLYTLVIDAENGHINERRVLPLVLRPPVLIDAVLSATDPVVPATRTQTHTLPILVEEHASRLELHSYRTEHATYMLHDATRLRDPSGRIIETHGFASALHHYEITDPEPGEWRLEYRYQSLTPNGQHKLEVQGAVSYH